MLCQLITRQPLCAITLPIISSARSILSRSDWTRIIKRFLSMIIMDKNLFMMRVQSDRDRIERALEIIGKVIAHRGCLVINWHNMYFFSDYLRMYTEILAYLGKRGRDVRLDVAQEPEHKLIW